MHPRKLKVCGLIVASVLSCGAVAEPQVYSGLCDASAAIAIDGSHFLLAEDENDSLSLYRHDDPTGAPLRHFDFSRQLHGDDDRESDIEGAARIGDRIYWITSHGRNRKGKLRANRYRLFATEVSGVAQDTRLQWTGRYDHLIRDLLNPRTWSEPDTAGTQATIELLRAATQLDKKVAKDLAPKKRGLNIEALAALADGSALLIGLRNPVPQGKALLIQLLNPDEVVTVADATARFGPPIYLDLQGLGIRSMDYSHQSKAFVIVAGAAESGGVFKLFRWNGSRASAPELIRELASSPGSHPEALVIYANSQRLQVLHDEGSMVHGTKACKDEKKAGNRHFSAHWYEIE